MKALQKQLTDSILYILAVPAILIIAGRFPEFFAITL